MSLSFYKQFNPYFDDMVLKVLYGSSSVYGAANQKLLLEHYLPHYNWKELNVLKIVIKIKYITPENEKLFQTVVLSKDGDWCGVNIVNSICNVMSKIEEDGNIVIYVCHIKGYSNKPPYIEAPTPQTIQLDNKVYEMDEDCNLTFIEEKDEDVPGFRY